MIKRKAKSKLNNYHHGDLPFVLLEAAEIELSENGIEKFSLRAVAKRAGVSHGAPAHHFKDVRGLLTDLATMGYKRFVEYQINRQRKAKTDAKSQSIASGLGYIDFAVQNPALFRLMFSSEIPNRMDADFAKASLFAFDKLVMDIQKESSKKTDTNPGVMSDVVSSWSMVHGLADLIISGRLERPLGLSEMTPEERDELLSSIIARAKI